MRSLSPVSWLGVILSTSVLVACGAASAELEADDASDRREAARQKALRAKDEPEDEPADGATRGDGDASKGASGASDAEVRGSGSRDQRLLQAYAKFTFESCADDPGSCPQKLARSVGAAAENDYNPRESIGNPDPEFLVEWTKLPKGKSSARYTWRALALAAVHRTWLARCETEYASWSKATTDRLAELEGRLEKTAKETNPYERLAAVRALEPPKPKKGAMFEFAAGSDVVRWRWEVAQFDAFEETKRTFVYVFDSYAPTDELIRAIHPRQGRDYERDAFCLDASMGRVAGVPPLPDTSKWDEEVRGMVRLAVAPERKLDLEKRREDLERVARARFAKALLPNPQLPSGVKEHTLETIRSFERTGQGAVVTVLRTREEPGEGPTSKPRLVKIDETATATFGEWPANVVLSPGDTVAFYGAETNNKDTVIKSTPELEHLSRQTSLEARHLTRVVAGGRETRYFR